MRKIFSAIGATLSFIFGKHSMPGFVLWIRDLIRKGTLRRFFGRSATFLVGFVKRRRGLSIAIGAAAVAGIMALVAFRIIIAYQPQRILIRVEAETPPLTDYEEYTVYPLTLHFDGSAAPADGVDAVVESGIAMEPEMKGRWEWKGDETLVFTPEHDWPIDTDFTVRFAKDYFPDHLKVPSSCSFSTPPFRAEISDPEFYIDPEDSSVKRVLFTIKATHPIDTENIADLIGITPDITAKSGSLEKKRYSFNVSYDKSFTRAYIVSEPVGMPARTTDMDILFKAGLRSSLGGNAVKENASASVKIPGMSDYVGIRELSHQLVKTPDQKYDQVFILSMRGEAAGEDLKASMAAYVLPVDRPELPGLKASKNHSWNRNDIAEEVLAQSERLEIESLEGEKKYNAAASFRFRAEPGRYIYLVVQEGVKFYGGYRLGERYETIFKVADYPRELGILSEGSILSMQGDRKLVMLSRGVRNVDFKIGRVRPDDINHLVSQSYGNLPSRRFNGSRFNEYNITEQYRSSKDLGSTDPREAAYFTFDFSTYLQTIPDKNLRYGLFFFTVSDRDTGSSGDKRLILVTDLGFLVKGNSDGTKDVFVQSIANGGPAEGALVQVLGLNGNSVASGYTDASGHMQLPALPNMDKEREPTVITVTRGNDMSFMPWQSGAQQLDWSNFDVGGVVGASDPRTLTAFLFSDRGIYRPGDEMRIGAIVKAGDWNINLAKTPLELRIVDSRGSETFTKQVSLSSSGLEEVRWRTLEYSPTGTYQISLYLIREENERKRKIFLGSTEVKVEEFLPDNLAVTTSLEPQTTRGWISKREFAGRVGVRNLFGTPAAGNKVKAQITLSPGTPYFREYREFTFYDPYLKDRSYEEFLGEAETDAEGKASFDIDLSNFENATYNLRFYAEAYEDGSGRHVSGESSVLISPLPYLIGWQADGDLSYISKAGERHVKFIAIDPELKKTAVPDIKVTVEEVRYVSMLVRQPNGVYKYQSVKKNYPASERTVTIGKDGFDLPLATGKAGSFQVVVANGAGDAHAKFEYTVVGEENQDRSLERTAEVEIQLNKTDILQGEELEVFIKTPYAGSGLISIERDKVYSWKWFKSTGTSTLQKIRVPKELEGNGYLTVTFARAIDSKEIYMSPLCYGTAAFSISKESRTNKISLNFPSEAKPGKDFPITYSTAKPGKIIVFAIDEGILQVAQYRTPDPLGHFFKKRALEVRTSQILNLILPEYSVLRSLGAMGGGSDAEFLSRNLNPFRRKSLEPVAYWSGILDAGSEPRTINYRVPDYFNGTLRVMAVAVSQDAIGARADSATIRDTFTIKPNGPMAAVPGDEFEVSVTIANNRKGSGAEAKIELSVVPSKNLSLLSPAKSTIAIPEGQDRNVRFTVKALNEPGAAELTFTAREGGEASRVGSYMSVRPAMPYRVSLFTGFTKNGKKDVDIPRRLYPDLRTLDISASYVPLGMGKGLNVFLATYPYGCTEQILSATWPHLFTSIAKDVGVSVDASRETVDRTIAILQARQRQGGGIGMWTSLSYDNATINAYAMQFLLTAQEKGYWVPEGLLASLADNLRAVADGSTAGWLGATDRAFAIYVLTRNGLVTTSYVEALRKYLDKDLPGWETSYAGLYLAGSYALMKQDGAASAIINRAKREFKRQKDAVYYDELGYSSLYLYIVAKHFPAMLGTLSPDILQQMAASLEGDQYMTWSASMALMGFDAFVSAMPTAETGKYALSERDADKKEKELKASGAPVFSAAYSADAKTVRIENREALGLFWQVTCAGFDLAIPTAEEKHGIEVFREFRDSGGAAKTAFKLGDAVKVRLRFRASEKGGAIGNAAIVDMFPSGFEPDIASIRSAEGNGSWRPDYVDIREDRIVLFGSIGESLSEFEYTLRAVNQGKFTVPPLFAEAMYDRSKWALKPQESVSVTE